jgi:hypothetical protein
MNEMLTPPHTPLPKPFGPPTCDGSFDPEQPAEPIPDPGCTLLPEPGGTT